MRPDPRSRQWCEMSVLGDSPDTAAGATSRARRLRRVSPSQAPDLVLVEPAQVVLARRRREPHEAVPAVAAPLPSVQPAVQPSAVDENLQLRFLETVT